MTTTVLDYTTPGNYVFTAPNGMSSLVIECWGAGGCGGGMVGVNNTAAGGGGGGAYSKISSSPSFNFPVGYVTTGTVGLGAITGATPSAGGDSYIITTTGLGTICRAKGGGSVNPNSTTGASGGQASGGIGDIKYNGGNGANGNFAVYGGGGGGEGSSTSGNGSSSTNNNGGTGTDGGNGGNGYSGVAGGNGTNGQWTGGGGGGAKRTTTGTYLGGNGAHGRIRITYTIENALLCVIDEFL